MKRGRDTLVNTKITSWRVDGLSPGGTAYGPHWTIIRACDDFAEAEKVLHDAREHWPNTRMVKEVTTRTLTLLVAPQGIDPEREGH